MTVPARYTRTAMVLHWLIGALIIANILLVWSTDLLPDAAERPIVNLHKSFGVTVLGLAIMRLLWRLTHPAPPFPASYKPWERVFAHAVHYGFYVLIFCMPLSGWLHDSAWKLAPTHPLVLYGFIPWFRIGAVANLDPVAKEAAHSFWGQIHTSLAYVIYAMLTVHVVGALKHQFVDKEPELQRMLPGDD